jgi:hypothetical protein
MGQAQTREPWSSGPWSSGPALLAAKPKLRLMEGATQPSFLDHQCKSLSAPHKGRDSETATHFADVLSPALPRPALAHPIARAGAHTLAHGSGKFKPPKRPREGAYSVSCGSAFPIAPSSRGRHGRARPGHPRRGAANTSPVLARPAARACKCEGFWPLLLICGRSMRRTAWMAVTSTAMTLNPPAHL